jgi:hypothetical protein
MTGEALAALEATALARALRDSVWAYPLVNAAHVLGVAMLVGSIVPLDLRLLGLWRSLPLAPLWHVLTRTAAAGLVLAATCGLLLFITRATEYAASSLFLGKMVALVVGVGNALALRRFSPDAIASSDVSARRVRAAAGVSLVAWLTTLTLGRLVGYF